jgi:hypothetical protein
LNNTNSNGKQTVEYRCSGGYAIPSTHINKNEYAEDVNSINNTEKKNR